MGEVGDLRGLAAVDVQAPHLARAGARGQEEDGHVVGRPHRVGVGRLVGGEPPRARAVDVDQPEIGAALVRREVRRAQRVDEALLVGREREAEDARESATWSRTECTPRR